MSDIHRDSEDEVHSLLEPPSVSYSSTAVQRAFIVWTLLGHSNQFRDCCNYYMRLEELEETFTPEQKKQSRNYEYSLLTEQPPTSEFLLQHFPRLYPTNKVQYRYPDEMKKGSGFKVQGFNDLEEKTGASAEEIVETSQLIKKYCKTHQINIREFLREFQQYAKQCGVNPTVSNVAFYIKHRNVQEDRQLEANFYEYDLRFMNSPPTENYYDLDLMTLFNNAMRRQHISGDTDNAQGTSNSKPINVQNDCAAIPSNSSLLNGLSHDDVLPSLDLQAKASFDAKDDKIASFESVNNEVEEETKVNTRIRCTSECGIDDVLHKITDLNHQYGKEINNNDEEPIETKTKPLIDENKMQVITEHKMLIIEQDNGANDVTEHQPLLDVKPVEADTDVKTDKPMFAKKHKNQLIPMVIPQKQPTYCMKLKVKSKRSKAIVKKVKQTRNELAHQEAFMACGLNVSFNLIDFDISDEYAYNLSNDFNRVNNGRCSTSSR